MAFFTESISSRPRSSAAMSFFGAIASFFDRLADARNCSLAVQRLQDLSDRELADIGLAREDIVRAVYRDIYSV